MPSTKTNTRVDCNGDGNKEEEEMEDEFGERNRKMREDKGRC